MLGLVAVGVAVLYAGTATATSTATQQLQQAQQVLKDANTVQGIGWILAGIGFGLSLFPRKEEGDSSSTTHVASRSADIDWGPPDKDLPPPLSE